MIRSWPLRILATLALASAAGPVAAAPPLEDASGARASSPARGNDGPPALHERIDELIESARGDRPAAPRAPDAVFARRVYLDLTGRIPTARQLEAFVAMSDVAGSRQSLVDQLLRSPEHARHMQQVFDVMLMHRRPAKHVPLDQWRAYLYQAFRENRSWRQLTVELLSSDGVERRPAARFLLDRELKTEETVRDLGRLFLGRDLQCAQCHDHPLIEDYLQRHFHGLAAFLNRSYLFKDPKLKASVIGEKADGVVKFTSVFTSQEAEAKPRVLDGPVAAEPTSLSAPYRVKPDKTHRGVPTYSRRLQLAPAIAAEDNAAFRRNIANRLWALMMGRGLVEPVDMLHAGNPPSHPRLLDTLAEDLVRHDYDMRRILREIALSETYQRSSRSRGAASPDGAAYDRMNLKALSPEQLAWSTLQALGKVEEARAAAAAKMAPADSSDRPFDVEQAVEAALRPLLSSYAQVFVSANESSRFDATAAQALFLLNSDTLSRWLADSPLVRRLAAEPDDELAINDLYRSVLTRQPLEGEQAMSRSLLEAFQDATLASAAGAQKPNSPPSRAAAFAELARVMMCSAEFRFNH